MICSKSFRQYLYNVFSPCEACTAGYTRIGKENRCTIKQKVLEFKAEWQLVFLGQLNLASLTS